MTAVQSYYTANEKINIMLNAYTEMAKTNQVWVSVDGAGFSQKELGDEFCSLLGDALSQAIDMCVQTTPPRRRFLKIRSMDAQKKLFVKILYSCEEPVSTEYDQRYARLQQIVEAVDGYMRLQFTENENILKIAIPT